MTGTTRSGDRPAGRTAARSATRARLMAAGERLIGLHGIDGISLEDIARHAGQANKYAVQYHFGSRDGLIQAILDARISAVEARRQALMATMDPASAVSILAVFVGPLAEQVDADGDCAFARFLLQFATQFQPWPNIVHPLRAAGQGSVSLMLFKALCGAIPTVAPAVLGRRLMLLMHLPLRALLPADAAMAETYAPTPLADVIAMMAAALAVPEPA